MNRSTRSTSKQNKPSAAIPLTEKTVQLSSLAPKIPSKYLRRTLRLNHDKGGSLISLRIKRIHIRKLIEIDREAHEEGDDYEAKKLEKTHKRVLKKKLFKSLTHIQIYSLSHCYWLEDLKHSKNLVKFNCEPYQACRPPTIAGYFKRLSKNLQNIELVTDPASNISTQDMKKLYKAIGSFPKLKSYQGKRKLDPADQANHQLAQDEAQSLYNHLKRLRYLQNLNCYFPQAAQAVLRDLMNTNKIYPKVTKLTIHLHEFCQLPQAQRNQPPAFFQFGALPNLKTLELKSAQTHTLLGPFIAQGLQGLKSLEKLHLKLSSQCPKLHFIFEALLGLPSQLSAFSISIDCFQDTDWKTFITFIRNQKDLVSLKFNIENLNSKNMRLLESNFLEDFLASLSQKPKLQYLALNSNYWPLSTLSKGLKRLVNTDQLISFELRATSNVFSLPKAFSRSPFEGLSEFLLRNKETLRELIIDLPSLKEQRFNKEISMAISQLSRLKNFWPSLSTCSLKECEERSRTVFLNDPMNSKDGHWDPCLDSILPKLEKLEDLTLDFGMILGGTPQERKWLSRAFKILPSLSNLRRFEFMVPESGLTRNEVTIINSVLEGLKHLNLLNFIDFDGMTDPNTDRILDRVEKLALRQALRMNYSF